MSESEKIPNNYFEGEELPFEKSNLLIIRDKTNKLVSVCACYGLTVIHARENGTTLYHLNTKSDCPGYMTGISRRSAESGFEVSWGYSDSVGSYTLSTVISSGRLTETTRRPRVFSDYHLGSDVERFNPTGAPVPKQQVSVGDNLLDLLGIENAEGDASTASQPSYHAQTPSSPKSGSESTTAPHRAIMVDRSRARAYLESLRA